MQGAIGGGLGWEKKSKSTRTTRWCKNIDMYVWLVTNTCLGFKDNRSLKNKPPDNQTYKHIIYVFTWGRGERPHEERHPVEAALVDRVVVGGHDHLCVQLVGSLVC